MAPTMSLMLMLGGVLLLTGFDAREAAAVAIEVRAVKSAVLVGEPLALVVTVRTAAPSRLELLIDRGGGFAAYRGKPFASGWHEVEGGGWRVEYVVSYDTRLRDWPFAAPGPYRLCVEYEDPSLGRVRSSAVTFSVTSPTGNEKAVHDALRRMGPQLLDVHGAHRLGELLALAQRFPDSVYLQEARLNDLNARIAEAARAAVRERLAALIPDVEAAASVPSPFQPEVLLVLAALQDEIGHEPAARSVYERIVQEFPDREAARLARRETRH